MQKFARNRFITLGVLFGAAALFVSGAVFLVRGDFFGHSFEVGEKPSGLEGTVSESISQTNENVATPTSPIAGIPCETPSRRPVAVMLAGDREARPLSGIGHADLVVEMPVITGGISRFMAVFQCARPQDIGSVRSARHDFIPLAMGLDAVYVHWGGSHFALKKLNAKIMDNIDALRNPYGAFYRKSGIRKPHNGFTTTERLLTAAGKLGYRPETTFAGYPHLPGSVSPNHTEKAVLTISYLASGKVRYDYSPDTNSYLRWRGNTKEIDKLTGKQVETKNVIVMRASSRQIEGQYNEVEIEGRGEAVVYRNGEEIQGIWEKDKNDPKSKLHFYLDEGRQEILFVPGSIWVQIVEPSQVVEWKLNSYQ